MIQNIIVSIIVAGAVFFIFRTIVRTFQGKKRCACSIDCSCSREEASSCTQPYIQDSCGVKERK